MCISSSSRGRSVLSHKATASHPSCPSWFKRCSGDPSPFIKILSTLYSHFIYAADYSAGNVFTIRKDRGGRTG
jgi:hypothetical protein